MNIACALDPAKFEERRALLAQLARLATEHSVIPGGMAFCFEPAAGLVGRLASFVELERAWLWLVEKQTPDRFDLAGTAIIYFGPRGTAAP